MISIASFVVMLVTIGVNFFVVSYEWHEADRLGSEVLMADAIQARGDIWSSFTVIVALAGARLGWPILDPVAALRARGYLVRRLEDGFPEWKAAGLPIEARA